MARKIFVKLVKNKANGQLNFSIPKKQISKEKLAVLEKTKFLKIKF